jgi:hypothetical protein
MNKAGLNVYERYGPDPGNMQWTPRSNKELKAEMQHNVSYIHLINPRDHRHRRKGRNILETIGTYRCVYSIVYEQAAKKLIQLYYLLIATWPLNHQLRAHQIDVLMITIVRHRPIYPRHY